MVSLFNFIASLFGSNTPAAQLHAGKSLQIAGSLASSTAATRRYREHLVCSRKGWDVDEDVARFKAAMSDHVAALSDEIALAREELKNTQEMLKDSRENLADSDLEERERISKDVKRDEQVLAELKASLQHLKDSLSTFKADRSQFLVRYVNWENGVGPNPIHSR